MADRLHPTQSSMTALVCPEHGTPRWMPNCDHNEQIRRCDHGQCRQRLELLPVEPCSTGSELQVSMWGAVQLLAAGRKAQAESLLRSALPDDYKPKGCV